MTGVHQSPGPRLTGYEGAFASSILLDDGDGERLDGPSPTDMKHPLFSYPYGPAPGNAAAPGSNRAGRQLPPHDAPHRTPTRTPSPDYQWNSHLKPSNFNDGHDSFAPFQPPVAKSSSSTSSGLDPQGNLFPQLPFSPMFPPPFWAGSLNPQAHAYYGMMMNNPSLFDSEASERAGASGPPLAPFRAEGPNLGQLGTSDVREARPAEASLGSHDRELREIAERDAAAQPMRIGLVSTRLDGFGASERAPGGPTTAGSGGEGNRRTKSRTKERDAAPQQQRARPVEAAPKGGKEAQQSGKGERRRRGGAGASSAVELLDDGGSGGGGKSRPGEARSAGPAAVSTSPLIEQLKLREKTVDLSDLAQHMSEIAIDQYGSRLIQQKLEVASEEEKQIAFKSVLQKMQHLTTDVFGNYVIQKFFEYGSADQRRILAEQLVGQVLKLSLQMYGCRVVQKALDYVPIEQQVLLIGELKGQVLRCVEDQHGNHVIQKCIERLPTDRIGFIVDSFTGAATRMAKHCYGCRVIQRLIEYCASQQISNLIEEVLRNCPELATDQYGNYVVQHVMEHSSRPGDRAAIMSIVRKNVLSLSCHKYASNVIEKALACATVEERALLVNAIIGEPGDSTNPPLNTMMRDRFGNYIVQRVIAFAQGPQRAFLLWRLQEQMPALKKSNTYGKHIISALERAQTGRE